MSASILHAMGAASEKINAAAASIASGDLDGYVDATMQMTSAKLNVGIAAHLFHTQREMLDSVLDILV